MAEEKIPSLVREFLKTMEGSDVEKALSYFTDDAVWACPMGTFRGKDELRRYMTVMYEQMKDTKVKECGNGLIAQGNKVLIEHEISSTMAGKKASMLSFCAYEFEGDKIKNVRSAFDRLGMAQQVTSGLPKMMVNMIARQTEKGLH
jgi:limonene-1,2-epoxide hydrolase